jgi:hypothetical protein
MCIWKDVDDERHFVFVNAVRRVVGQEIVLLVYKESGEYGSPRVQLY